MVGLFLIDTAKNDYPIVIATFLNMCNTLRRGLVTSETPG